jgi:hypothetical protein
MNEAERMMIYELKAKKTSHILHLLLSLISGGLWIPVWVIVAINNSSVNSKLRNRLR